MQLLGVGRAKFGFALVGYVVMPEHVHLLVGEPPRATPSDVMRELKQAVALALLPADGNQGDTPGKPKQHRTFWQPRSYDFNVWSVQKKNEKLHYMHMNPVKRGLVRSPEDWPWSSYRAYMQIEPVMLPVDRVD